MPTATTKSRAARQLAGRPDHPHLSLPEPMEFLIFQDNGGSYHWTLIAGEGEVLARSGGLASHEEAAQAAHRIRDAATSARCELRPGGVFPGKLMPPGHGSDTDAERWLDEGGGFRPDMVGR